MSLREKLNNSPAGSIIVAAVLLLAAGAFTWFTFSGGGSSGPATGIYYYDTVAGELVVVPVDSDPPTTLDNGNTAVEANVFACGECPRKSTIDNVVYLRRISEAARSAVARIPDPELREEMLMDENAYEITDLENLQNDRWFPALSPPAMMIQQKLADLCPGDEQVRACYPR